LRKLITYSRYFYDYLKHGDLKSVIASIKYVVKHSSHTSDRIITTSAGTFFCRKNTNDFQFANYYYEWGVKKFILNHIHEFSVFIDAGACIGEYCIILAKFDKKCYAIEPMAKNINALEMNLKLNGLKDKIKVFPYGLGNSNDQVSFQFNPINTGASLIIREKTLNNSYVEIRTLDSLIGDLEIDENESILIKLDVEGMEPEAISGASRFIRLYSCLMFIIEDKHSGKSAIISALNETAIFEFGRVDNLNMYARKIRNF